MSPVIDLRIKFRLYLTTMWSDKQARVHDELIMLKGDDWLCAHFIRNSPPPPTDPGQSAGFFHRKKWHSLLSKSSKENAFTIQRRKATMALRTWISTLSIAKRSATKLRLHPRGERSCALSRSPARPSTLARTTSKASALEQKVGITLDLSKLDNYTATTQTSHPAPRDFFFPELEECE